MRKHFITLMLLLAAIATAFAGNEETARYKLNVQDFEEIEVIDGVTVEYFCNADSAGWAVFTCTPNLASHIMFTNEKNRLTIRTDCDEKPIVGVPVLKVFSTTLKKAINSGDSILTLHMDIAMQLKDFKARQIGNGSTVVKDVNCDNLDAGITAGNGTLSVSGKSRKAKLSNVSTGAVDARNLETVNINCHLFGTGNIECSPTENLKIFGAGSGKVIYHGSPKITTRGIGVKAVQYSDDVAYILYKKKSR